MEEKVERHKTKDFDITNYVDDTVLGEEDLRDVCRELVTIRALHYQLGVGLGLPPGEMDALKTGSGASQQVIDQAFSDVILKWLRQRYDVTRFGLPTWKRLVEAVKDPVGANNPALAVEIAAKHPKPVKEITDVERRTHAVPTNFLTDDTDDMDGSLSPRSPSPPDQLLLDRNMDTIQGKFASLLLAVQRALKTNEVLVDDVYQFMNQFLLNRCKIELDASCCTEFSVMFKCLTKLKVWTYDYHFVLEVLTNEFLSESQTVKDQIKRYKSALSGFFVATKLIDYITQNPFSDEELENQQDVPLPNLTDKQYKNLKVILNLSPRTISEQSLNYVRDLWEKFMEEFDLPQVATVIKKIVPGSLEITWIIWSRMAELILQKSRTPRAIKFFRKHDITLVDIDGFAVFDEQKMLKNERSFLKVCSLVPVNATNLSALLDLGMDPNIQNKDGSTGLILACSTRQKFVAELLIKAGADVKCCDTNGFTSLHHASMSGFDDIVEMLIDCEAEIDVAAKDERHCVTPLMLASKNGHRTVVELLIAKGANSNYTSKIGFTPLHYASLKGFSDVVKLLIDKGAEVDVPVKADHYQRNTALSLACRSGHKGVAKLLIQRGANINYRDKIGFTPLHYASQNGHFNVVLLLLERDAQVDSQAEEEKNCTTALILACQSGHKAIAELLIDKGANVDYQDKIGFTALHLASLKGDTDMVQLLINSSAQVDIPAKEKGNGDTALILACMKGHSAVAKLLVDEGADVNYMTKKGFTPLHCGSFYGHTDVVRLLLGFFAFVDLPAKTHNNPTALGLACMKGHTAVAELLLDGGANVNFQDRDGNTSLHYASTHGFAEIVRALVKHNAKIDIPSRSGMTAYEAAQMNLKMEICQLLHQYGYTPKSTFQTSNLETKEMSEKLSQVDPVEFLKTFRDVSRLTQSHEEQLTAKFKSPHTSVSESI